MYPTSDQLARAAVMDALAFIQPDLDEQQRQHELMRVLYLRFEASRNMLKAATIRRILYAAVRDVIGEFPKPLDNCVVS